MTLTGSEISLVGVEAREVEEKGKYSKNLDNKTTCWSEENWSE